MSLLKVIDERILDVVRQSPGAVLDSDIAAALNKRWPPGFNNESLYSGLKRLRLGHDLVKTAKGWNIPGRATVDIVVDVPLAPVQDDEIDALIRQPDPATIKVNGAAPAKEKAVTMKCGKCAGTDFTPGGNCRACQKRFNDAYAAKRKQAESIRADRSLKRKAAIGVTGEAKIKPRAVSAGVKSSTDLAVTRHGDRMVTACYNIKILDHVGVQRDISLSAQMIKRLAQELQDYL